MKRCLLISATSGDLWIGALTRVLDEWGVDLTTIDSSQIESTHCETYDLIVLDAAVTTDLRSTISKIRAQASHARIVVYSSLDDWRRAKEAMLAGAVDYAIKSLDHGQIVDILKECLRQRVPPVAPTTSEVRGGR